MMVVLALMATQQSVAQPPAKSPPVIMMRTPPKITPAYRAAADRLASLLFPDDRFAVLVDERYFEPLQSVAFQRVMAPVSAVLSEMGYDTAGLNTGSTSFLAIADIVDPGWGKKNLAAMQLVTARLAEENAPMPDGVRARKAAQFVQTYSQEMIEQMIKIFESEAGKMIVVDRRSLLDDPAVTQAVTERGRNIQRTQDAFVQRVDDAVKAFPVAKSSNDLTADERKRVSALVASATDMGPAR